MSIASRFSVLSLLMAFSAAATAQQVPVDSSGEMQKQFAEAYNSADLDAMMGHFTENAMRVTPSGIFNGREAIRNGLMNARGFSPRRGALGRVR